MFTNYLPFLGFTDLTSIKKMDDRVMTSLAFGMTKNSEFKELFDYHLLKLKQSSLVEKEVRRHLLNDAPLDDGMRSMVVREAESLGLGSVVFVFFIVGVGVIGALVMSVCERSAKLFERGF